MDTRPDTAGSNQSRPPIISGSGVRNPDGALSSNKSLRDAARRDPRIREAAVQSIDEPMRFVELPPQVNGLSSGGGRSTALHRMDPVLGGFQLVRDVLDLLVQRLQQLFGLCGVGIIGHA